MPPRVARARSPNMSRFIMTVDSDDENIVASNSDDSDHEVGGLFRLEALLYLCDNYEDDYPTNLL